MTVASITASIAATPGSSGLRISDNVVDWFLQRGISRETLEVLQGDCAMRRKLVELTQTRLHEIFVYNPDTGTFTRRGPSRGVKSEAPVGSRDGKGYIGVRVDGGRYLAHRLAFLWMTGAFPEKDVDHVNGKKDDNRWVNLRQATPSQNACNVFRRPGLLPIGVERFGKKYRAKLTVNGRGRHLGMFISSEEASAAYLSELRRLHGDFVRGSK